MQLSPNTFGCILRSPSFSYLFSLYFCSCILQYKIWISLNIKKRGEDVWYWSLCEPIKNRKGFGRRQTRLGWFQVKNNSILFNSWLLIIYIYYSEIKLDCSSLLLCLPLNFLTIDTITMNTMQRSVVLEIKK